MGQDKQGWQTMEDDEQEAMHNVMENKRSDR